ncbi:MAG: DUF2490 domain-containing protein [Planctomycetota bacterium]
MDASRLTTLLLGSALALAVPHGLAAQTRNDSGLWLGVISTGRFAPAGSEVGNFRWWLEAQDRQRDEGQHFDLGFVRPGLGYALTDRVTVWAGYGYFLSDPVGRAPFEEHRVWQQVTWSAPVAGLTLQSRTRLEERFVETGSDTGWRVRQMVKATLPVTHRGQLFLSVWDEGFFDANDTDWGQRQGFRQNRAFAGLGAFFDEAHTKSVEIGYVNQWIDRPGRDAMNHALVVWFFLNF